MATWVRSSKASFAPPAPSLHWTIRGRLEGLSKRLAAANADAKRKKDAYEAAAAMASRLEQEKKELHEHLAMMVLSSEQRKEDKLKELLAAMGATDVS